MSVRSFAIEREGHPDLPAMILPASGGPELGESRGLQRIRYRLHSVPGVGAEPGLPARPAAALRQPALAAEMI